MLQRLKSLFANSVHGEAETPPDRLQLAAAALLVETAVMDGELAEVERDTILTLLIKRFALSEADAQALVSEAEQQMSESVSLVSFTRILKEHLDEGERAHILELLWRVAYADGEIHDYEANLARRIAGLLHVPDRLAGSARKRAQSEST